ncbi:MAG: permease-like cell division protein FtsX [Gammaproteobacteria bacterium]|nr:permease-like cell division protein FtsX [Gammaproteobacteria bacterium]
MKHQGLKQLYNILTICLDRIAQYRLANLVTVLLLTATLSLPALFWLVTANLNKVSHQWYNSTEVSVYLKSETKKSDIENLMAQLHKDLSVAEIHYISPEEGLKEMAQQSNLQSVLQTLPNNPLPGVIAVKLKPTENLSETAKKLQATLAPNPIIETVQIDSLWLQRLQGMLSTLKKLSFILGILLIVGGILIVSNSIQLTLEKHRHEIEIYQLVGANSLFIRAPFLISGLFIGLTAGMLTWVVVNSILLWLLPNVDNLAALYQSTFQLTDFGFVQGIVLCLASGVLGTVGAVVASRDFG